MLASPQEVLEYWFGPPPLAVRGKLWWRGGDAVDREIEQQFSDTVEAALAGQLDHWSDQHQGVLALVVVLDQFTRNMFRGTARAFAGDPGALSLVLAGLEQGDDEQLHPLEASFFYMPLEHSESLAMQDRCVRCFEKLLLRTGESHREYIRGNLDFAEDHRQIIRQFHRFPHRNRVLDRISTDAELAYLASGGHTYGQG
jgi:uncharacterized protein (DUF924 family)